MAERGSLPEAQQGEGTWTAEHFREYLRAMSHNTWEQDFCLEQKDFPRRIDLSPDWQETFAAMRQSTAEDGYERWGLIGVTEARDKVMVSRPQSFVRGSRDEVSGEDQ